MTTIEVVTERVEQVKADWGYVHVPNGAKIRSTFDGSSEQWQTAVDGGMLLVTGDFRLIVCKPGFVT